MTRTCTACTYRLGEGVGPRCPECGVADAFAVRPSRMPEHVLGWLTVATGAYTVWCASGCFIAAGHGAMQARDLLVNIVKEPAVVVSPAFALMLLPPLLALSAVAPLLVRRMPRWRKCAAAIAAACAVLVVAGCVLATDSRYKAEIAFFGARVITPPIAMLALVAFARPLARYFAPPARA